MSIFSDELDRLMKQSDMSNEALGELVGVNRTTVSRWRSGERSPKMTKLSEIANVFNVDARIFVGEMPVSDITTVYNQLVPPRQEKVYNFAERQLEEQNRGNVVRFPKKEKLPTIKNSASAANPTELVYGDTVVEEEEFERVPSNADFAVPIIGDSMEPVIKNGQFVFVKEQPDVEDGEIAIVEIDGDGVTCKEVFKDYENQSIILRSINELYEDRVVSPEQIRIIGKVVF